MPCLQQMTGMMDTVLNLGLNDTTVEALAKKSGDRRFAFDSYRRFVQMYSDVVLGIEINHFEKHLERAKEKRGVKQENGLEGSEHSCFLLFCRCVKTFSFCFCVDSWTFLGVTADLTTFIWFPPLSTYFTSFTSFILSEIIPCRTVSCFQRIWRSWSSLTKPWSSWSLARSSQRIQKHSFGEPLVQSSIPGWISVQRPTGTWLYKD